MKYEAGDFVRCRWFSRNASGVWPGSRLLCSLFLNRLSKDHELRLKSPPALLSGEKEEARFLHLSHYALLMKHFLVRRLRLAAVMHDVVANLQGVVNFHKQSAFDFSK